MFDNNHLTSGPTACEAIDPSTGARCGREGSYLTFSTIALLLCRPCMMRVCNWRNEKLGNQFAKLDKAGALNGDTEGWMYAVRMSSGNVKFGISNRPESRKLHRLREVSIESNEGVPVELLGITKGGLALENLTHERFREHRVHDRMEEFEGKPEVVEYAMSLGFPAELNTALARWREWSGKRNGVTFAGFGWE